MHISEFRGHIKDLRKFAIHSNQAQIIADEMESQRHRVNEFIEENAKLRKVIRLKDFMGVDEGSTCNRRCQGTIELRPVENCSCHIAPPCSACMEPAEFCPVCDWDAREE